MNKSSAFDLLHTKVQKWVWNQDWGSLREIQENAIPIVLKADSDVIISASTAGGKTEAAFLPILSRILKDEPTDGYSVLYISPLKALINDQYRRLTEMTSGMGIDVIPWHGDIDASRKQKSLKHPNGIVIITPESLESFFMNKSQYLNRAFSSLKYVVIDELHSFIGNERGKQLQSLLSRLEIITKRAVPRIAMSATFSSYDVVTQFLRPDSALPCQIPPEGESNHETKIILKYYQELLSIFTNYDVIDELYNKLRGSNNLVFTNSIADAENYSAYLSNSCHIRGVPNEFRVHHGHLSKSERERVEHELQKGEHPITAFCTSTLELGVDIGKVKSVVQLGVANSVSSLRQRLGRSGRRNEPSILRVLTIEYTGTKHLHAMLKIALVQNIAVIELLREKQYETPATEKLHLSTLIQQILSVLSQYGSFFPKDGWQMLCQNGAFRNVTANMFLELLKSLGERKVISQLHNGQIVIGEKGEDIVKKKDFYVAFQTTCDVTIINLCNSQHIGTIQYLPELGDAILLASKGWVVERVDSYSRVVYVNHLKDNDALPIQSMEPGAGVDRLVTERMKQIYLSSESYPYLDTQTNLQAELDFIRDGFQKCGWATTNIISFFYMEFYATWAGTKINRTIVLIIAYYFDTNRRLPYFDNIFIRVTLNTLKILYKKGKPSPEVLAANRPRRIKMQQKYDYLLSDELLDIEHANSYFDVDGAWEVIQSAINKG